MQVKALMAKGQLPVSNKKAPKIGALIAQSELGDIEDLNQTLCYPQYFKEWTPGVARAIAKEHTNLIGKNISQDSYYSNLAMWSS